MVARTPILGFRDDVVVRVRADPDGGARLDFRSTSRYGRHDFGTNAARIVSLSTAIDDAVGEVVEKPSEAVQKAKKAEQQKQQKKNAKPAPSDKRR